MNPDHITAVVTDADVAAEIVGRLLGTAPIAEVSLPGMSIRSFRLGDMEIHLNAPTGPGAIDDHHRQHGPGYHHLALRVDDLDTTLAELAPKGFNPLGAPVQTAPGIREVFLDPATTAGLMIQLVERTTSTDEPYSLDPAGISRLAEQMKTPPV